MTKYRKTPFTHQQLEQIAKDDLPCSHGRIMLQREIAARNNISETRLHRLISGEHPQSEAYHRVKRRVKEGKYY